MGIVRSALVALLSALALRSPLLHDVLVKAVDDGH